MLYPLNLYNVIRQLYLVKLGEAVQIGSPMVVSTSDPGLCVLFCKCPFDTQGMLNAAQHIQTIRTFKGHVHESTEEEGKRRAGA